MNNTIQEQERRRLDIIYGISKGYEVSKIAKRLDVPRWIVIKDLKRMQYYRDSKLRDAYKHAKEQSQLKKQIIANQPDERFQLMTGMTLQEKTCNNMMFFYRPELKEIIKSDNEGDAIRELPVSVRRTMKRNGIITAGWKYLQITEYARAYLSKTTSVES